MDAVADGLLVVNLAGEIIYINEKMHLMWDIASEQTQSRRVLASVVDQIENPEVFLIRVREIYSNKAYESYDIIKRKDGKTYERLSKPLFIGDNILGRVWTYRDITSLVEIENSLKESEDKLQVVYEAERRYTTALALLDRVGADINDVLDLNTLFKDLLHGIKKVYGYALLSIYLIEEEKLVLQYQIGYPQVIDVVYPGTSVSWRAIKSQTPLFIHETAADPDFLEAFPGIESQICIPLFNNDKPVGVLNIESTKGNRLTNRDLELMNTLGEHLSRAIGRTRLITDIKIQQKRFEDIFDYAPIGMSINKLDGTFVKVNRSFEKSVGYSQNELQNFTFAQITHPEDLENNLDWLQRLLRKEIDSYRFEKRYIRKDGTLAHVYLQVSLFLNWAQEPEYILAQIVDITDLKMAERALMQKQKMESIGVLAGGIAHDFNNLLVALTAQSALALAKTPEQCLSRKHIIKTQEAADKATQLTKQLLAYSGKGRFEVVPVDLNEEIEKNVHLFQVAVAKNVAITTSFDSGLPTVMADKGQMQQILMNLIINGAEAVGERGGSVKIKTGQNWLGQDELKRLPFFLLPPAPGKFVTVSISDDGVGMSEDVMAKIFDPFFSTKFTGRGLGLAAVSGIVRSHNGGMIVESVPEKGTTFVLFFPVAVQQRDEHGRLPKKQSISQPIVSEKKVLLIDDDIMVRDTLQDIFEAEKIKVLSAADGTAGLHLFKTCQDDIGLILLDLSMPGISSQETFEALRTMQPNIPIILCSGYSEHEINTAFVDQTYDGFIQKPFEVNQIIDAISHFLQ